MGRTSSDAVFLVHDEKNGFSVDRKSITRTNASRNQHRINIGVGQLIIDFMESKVCLI